jgi:alkylation response protein AidB-like acyl-CoA dehydrogenase
MLAPAEDAAEALQTAWQAEDDLGAEARGACAVATATAKVAAAQVALDITSRVFEVVGARATSTSYRFDRFWRNVRTLSLHDPLDYKRGKSATGRSTAVCRRRPSTPG